MSLVSSLGVGRVQAYSIVASLVLIGLVLRLSEFWTFVFTGGLATATIALSVGVIYGRTGMVSLCQFSFAAVGVWVMTWLNVHTGLPFVALLLFAGLSTIPVGLLIGFVSLRLRGINLAVATLGFAAATLVVLRKNPFAGSFTNQPIARPAGFQGENGYFVFCCIVFTALVGGLALTTRTRVGRGWLAVRQSERATAALGLSVTRVKLSAFAVGAFIAGIGGGLLAGQNGIMSNRSFEPFDSLLIFAVSVLAGARYIDGALAAGLLGAVLPELFRKWGIPLDVAPMLFGVFTIAVLSQGAEGAHGQLRTTWEALRASTPAGAQVAIDDLPLPDSLPVVSSEEHDLVIEYLSVSYGAVRALKEVNLTIRPMEVHGLVGPNGAGKSTLIDAITGFIAPTNGTIHLGSTCLDALAVHQRSQAGIRRTFQQGRTVEDMKVGDYISFAAARNLSAGELKSVLDYFGCPPAATRISTVEVGTRRLVEVAGAVASGASVVLLDEPGAGLGLSESLRLAERIKSIPGQFGCSVLVVEHDMEIIRGACDRLTVLDFGEVIDCGPPVEVLSNQKVISAYLGHSETVLGASR